MGHLALGLDQLAAANHHPLTWLSLATDRVCFGPGATQFHLTNLLLHAPPPGGYLNWRYLGCRRTGQRRLRWRV